MDDSIEIAAMPVLLQTLALREATIARNTMDHSMQPQHECVPEDAASARSKDNQTSVVQAVKLPFAPNDPGVHRYTTARFMVDRNHGRSTA